MCDQLAQIQFFFKFVRMQTDNLEEEMGVGGATADDADQEVIKNVLESEIVGKKIDFSLYVLINTELPRFFIFKIPQYPKRQFQ